MKKRWSAREGLERWQQGRFGSECEKQQAINVTLSQRRDDSVRAYLLSRGIGADRIQAKGSGPDEPLTPNVDNEGRQKNRPIEFQLLQ